MSPERSSAGAGYLPRLLAAAAFVTRRATEESLSELRLTQDRTTVLGILAAAGATEAALADASGLTPECVSDCLEALRGCGYASPDPAGVWNLTATGTQIHSQVEQAGSRLLSGDSDDALRRELSGLIRALRPPSGGAQAGVAPDGPVVT